MSNDTQPVYQEIPMNDNFYLPPPSSMGYMPSMPQQDATIANMRWNPDRIIVELYRILGGYDVKVDDEGNVKYIRRNPKIVPKINDVGLEAIASMIQSNVNPVTALSKISEENAQELYRQTMYDISGIMTINVEEYGIKDKDLALICLLIKQIFFMQVNRAVDGHESKNFRTQTMEQNTTMNQAQQQKGGLWNTLFGRKG